MSPWAFSSASGNAAPVATASSVQVRQPIYSGSVERWRRYGEGSRRAIAALGEYGLTAPPG